MKPKIIIVDENDKIIGSKPREVLNPDDIYRVSALWLTNSRGDVLLARRSLNKKHDPGKWGPAVAGTVEAGETYEENIIKEAAEELGLTGFSFKQGQKVFNDGKYKHFTYWYTLDLDRKIEDFDVQKDEVEEIKWFSNDKLLREIEEHPDLFLDVIRHRQWSK